MHDPGQRRQFGAQEVEQPGHVIGVRDVGGHGGRRRHTGRWGVDALLSLAGGAPAGQHQTPGAPRGQVAGNLQADRAQPTGHQIGCVTA